MQVASPGLEGEAAVMPVHFKSLERKIVVGQRLHRTVAVAQDDRAI